MDKYDFEGWATKANLKCSDGRIIMKDAFKHCDGHTVPLVWNHRHDEPYNVLGHALLQNRDEGVYAYCAFNETENGQLAKVLVQHGDISALSIYANQLKQNGPNVQHGMIREVSLVHAGANPGACIQAVLQHSDDGESFVLEDEAVIHTGETFSLYHADDKKEESKVDEKTPETTETLADVFNTLSEKQKEVVYAMIGQALQHSDEEESDDDNDNEDSEGGNATMKHNVFDPENNTAQKTLSHSDMQAIIGDAKRMGSLRDSFLAHVETAEGDQNYGIVGTDWLFPEAKSLNNPPEFIKRDTSWVSKVMGAVHHTPFSRIKSVFADITEDEARAKGYMKGNLKKEEVFGLLKRSTTPTTIYKKQKMDRDDVIDITDFDVIAWIKREMRLMLDEEIARAILIGDGRLNSSDDKINELNIRPVWTDEELFTIKTPVVVAANATDDQKAKAFIRAVVKSRKNYKGSGSPTMYTTEDVLTDLLLLEDSNGRIIYDSVDKLKSMLRVSDIVTVPVMEGLTREDGGKTKSLMALIVNLKDYNVGADKGGAISMFDDFDIDYNQMKYLIETRCSGALIKPFSAIAIEMETATA